MNNVQKLTAKMNKIYAKFGVDARDIELLAFISGWWEKNKVARVMDVVKTATVASPSTVVSILKDLEFVGMVSIATNLEDAREKIIGKGKKFAALDKALEGV